MAVIINHALLTTDSVGDDVPYYGDSLFGTLFSLCSPFRGLLWLLENFSKDISQIFAKLI